MTKPMERQRVLYSAKTKTTKVVPTSSTRRPLSLPTSFQTDDLPAPLASIESDVSLITKCDRECPKSHISRHVQIPSSPLTDSCDGKASNKDITLWKRDSSNTELVRSTPARSTIRIRNLKTCDIPKSHSSYRGYPKHHRPRSEGVTDAASQRDIKSDSDLSVVNSYTHQRLHNGWNHKVRPTSSIVLDRTTQGSKGQIECTSDIKRRTQSYPEEKEVQNMAPPIAPKPKNNSKFPATEKAPTRNKICNTTVLESSPLIVQREGHASSKENHVVSENSLPDSNRTSKLRSKKGHTRQNLDQKHSQSNHHTASSFTNHSETPNNIYKYPAKGLLPERFSPLKYPHNDNGEAPEMYLAATTKNNHRTTSLVPGQRKDQVVPSKSHKRKPLANISITSNTPTSSIEDIHAHSDLNTSNSDISRNKQHQNDQNNFKTTRSPVYKDHINTDHAVRATSDECDHYLDGDFKPRWKRNSMRLATQGYTSMSDLTESVECLNACEQEVSKSARSPRVNFYTEEHDEKQAETFLKQSTTGKTSEKYEPCSDRLAYNTISNNVSFSIEEVNKSNINCDTINSSIFNDSVFVALARNGMNRPSYRLATSGVANAWTQESDGRGYLPDTNLSPVTERSDGDMMSDHSNLATEQSIGGDNQATVSSVALNTQTFSSTSPGSDIESNLFSQTSESSIIVQNIKQSDAEKHSEHLNKVKRWSYLLATTASISDLTLLDADLDFVDSSGSNNNTNSEREVSNSATIHTQRGKHRADIQHGQTRGRSYYNSTCPPSSKRNNSGINNASDKSADKTVFPESTTVGSSFTKQVKDTPPRHGPCVMLDSSDLDSTDSGNTSCYYSASPDTSFVTADGDPANSEHSHDSRQWSAGPASPRQRSASQLHGDHLSPRSVSQTHDSHRLAASLKLAESHRLAPTDKAKSSPLRSMEDRRSSNLHSHAERSYGPPVPDQYRPGQRDTSQPLSPDDPKHVSSNTKQHKQQSCHNNIHNNISKPASHIPQNTKGPKHSSPASNVLQCYGCGLNERQSTQTRPCVNTNNIRETLNVSRNRDTNSTTHRRHPEDFRKMPSERNRFLYPVSLPGNMPVRIRKYPPGSDLFLKDQSSTPSFGSIASFTEDMRWETTPRFPPSLGRPRRKLYAGFDSQPLPMDSYTSDSSSVFSIQTCGSWGASRSAEVESRSKFPDVAPSIRSVSSIAFGSTRSLSDNDEPSFLADSNNINFYNFYPHFNNVAKEHCLGDSFHGKNFSRESLESCVSDATTIEENMDYKSDFAKVNVDYNSCIDIQHKNVTIVQSEQRTNDKSHKDKLNNGSVLGSVGSKCHGDTFEGNKRQQDVSKASFCAPMPRSMRKGKFLSSKDILDLILTPDKSLKKDSSTLEKQAQKMYEVILCCNEVDFPPARECHF